MKQEILRSLQRSDLNALVTLSVLLDLRSTTAAAERLSKTQSAVSHTLKKLRDIFADELLVQQGKSLELTARARALQPLLEKTLSELNRLIAEPDGFSPEHSVREFRVAAPNFYTGLIADLSNKLKHFSGHLSLFLQTPDNRSFGLLVENQLDLLIAPAVARAPSGIGQANFDTIDWVVYASGRHPISSRTMKRQWLKWPHVQVVTGNTSRSPVDDALAAADIQRYVSLRVPDFISAMAAVSANDSLLFTAPDGPLREISAALQLKRLSCPFDLPKIPMSVYTSKNRGQSEDVSWLRERLFQLAA